MPALSMHTLTLLPKKLFSQRALCVLRGIALNGERHVPNPNWFLITYQGRDTWIMGVWGRLLRMNLRSVVLLLWCLAVAHGSQKHAFDSNGRMFNQRGKLEEWWTNSTSENFNVIQKCISKQYSCGFILDYLEISRWFYCSVHHWWWEGKPNSR